MTVLVQLNGLAVVQYGKLFTSTLNSGFIYFCYNGHDMRRLGLFYDARDLPSFG